MKIIILVFCLSAVLACSPQNIDMTIVKIKDVRLEERIDLDIDSKKGPHGIRILISGIINTPAKIEIFDKDGLQSQNEIKSGKIHLMINKEWYSDAGYIQYSPSSNSTQGDISIEYGLMYIDSGLPEGMREGKGVAVKGN